MIVDQWRRVCNHHADRSNRRDQTYAKTGDMAVEQTCRLDSQLRIVDLIFLRKKAALPYEERRQTYPSATWRVWVLGRVKPTIGYEITRT